MENRKCILNVDDHDAGRYATTRILKKAGFDVLEASSGKEALKMVRDERPHLVLLDVNLPDMSGFHVCKAIKSLPYTASTAVVHLSATYVDSQDKSMGLEFGADGYLVQPVEPRELIATLRAFLRLKETEEALRLREQEFRALAENAPDMVVRFDKDFHLCYVNPALEKEIGMPRERLIGHPPSDLPLSKVALESWNKLLNEVLLQGKEKTLYFDLEFPSRKKYYHTRIVPEFAEDGSVETILSITRDITALKERDEALEASEAKSEFLANISHELRTPLHAILSYAEIGLEESKSSKEGDKGEYFHKIQVSGQRLLHLINDLLDLSKIESRNMSYMLHEHDLYSLIQIIADEMEPMLEEKKITLEIERPEISTIVRVDKERMLQVLRNIIANAMKFSPNESTIRVLFFHSLDPPSVGVHIIDEGCGINEEDLDLIFDKFSKGRRTSGKFGGTGLGLAICREILNIHEGEICAKNEEEGGARISIRLPLELEEG